MLRKLNKNTIFIAGAFLISILLALIFEFAFNKVFPQPSFFFSSSRLIANAVVICGTICFIKYRKYFCHNLHKAFLLLSLIFGIAFILVFPRTVYVLPDDQIHFRNAYFFMSDTIELKGEFSAIESKGFTNLGTRAGFSEMAGIYENIDGIGENIIDGEYHISESPQLYNRIVYLPFYIGFKLSDALHLTATKSLVVAKICNLIYYIALVYFAIKISGRFSKVFFLVGLLMCNIFLATQFSYDPVVTANLFLAIGCFLHIMQTKNPSSKYLLGFVIATVIGSLAKAVYCPLLLLVLLIPNDKFDCKKRAIVFKICTMFVMLVLASVFVLPMLGGNLASDIRGGNTSVSGQIDFLLHNPLKAIIIAAYYIGGRLPDYVILGATGTYMGSGLVYEVCQSITSIIGITILLVLLRATFTTYLDKSIITNRLKIGLALIYTIIIGSITMSMYLGFTEVGSMYISGVQPRYFVPVLPLLLIIFMPTKQIHEGKSPKKCDTITVFAPYVCLMLVFIVYTLQMSHGYMLTP